MTIWVAWFYDVGPMVMAIYTTAEAAIERSCRSGYYITKIELPCEDVSKALSENPHAV